MKLAKWVEDQVRKTGGFKTHILKDLAARSGVSLLTLQQVERGGRMDSYTKAKQVSEATDNKVKIRDLCEA